MDFPENKYHESGFIPAEYHSAIDGEDVSDAPTVIIPRPPAPPPRSIEEWWFIEIPF